MCLRRVSPHCATACALFQGVPAACAGAWGDREGPVGASHRQERTGHHRCGRCVKASALRAVGQSNHCRIRDLAQTLQRQGFQAIAALERDDQPTIRERVPRRLPPSTGNRTVDAKKTDAGALHTSRTALIQLLPTVMRRRADGVRRGRVVCTCYLAALGVMTEATVSMAFGMVSPPMQDPIQGAFTLFAPGLSPRTIRRWMLPPQA